MPNFEKYNCNQEAMVVINFEEQLRPGGFEFTLHHLIDKHIDLSFTKSIQTQTKVVPGEIIRGCSLIGHVYWESKEAGLD